MAKHMVKCVYCGQMFDINTNPFRKIRNGTRYVHEECYEKFEKEQEEKLQREEALKKEARDKRTEERKRKAEEEKKKVEEEKKKNNEDKEILFNYINELYGTEFVSPWIQRQISDYIEKYHYTYSGIYKTLVYFFQEEGHEVNTNNGIGIVPWVYDEARKYYYAIYKAQQYNINKDITQYIPKKRDIVIPNPHTTLPRKKKFTFLDKEE